MHEADNIERIIAEEHRRKMLAGVTEDGAGGRGHKKNPAPTLAQGLGDNRETRTQIAEAVGMKARTFAKVKQVHDAAHDDTLPAPILAVAQQQMAALDTGRMSGGKSGGRDRPSSPKPCCNVATGFSLWPRPRIGFCQVDKY